MDHHIRVLNPRQLRSDTLPAERIPLGVINDYKPCIARLSDGSLAIVAFHQHQCLGNRILEEMVWQSWADGGHIWLPRQVIAPLGREPYISALRDGTLLLTAHLLPQDVRNTTDSTLVLVHRSTDNGATWESMVVVPADIPGAAPDAPLGSTRNILELRDGTLLFGVGAPRGQEYLWRSRDGGRSWNKGQRMTYHGAPAPVEAWWCPMLQEAMLWETRCGDLLSLSRVDPRLFPPLPGTIIPAEDSDQYERLVLFRSRDGGANWVYEEFGSGYGEMYPALLRLKDGRLLLTFTVRSIKVPLGVQAVLGTESDDGFRFDFEHDRLVLDEKTPPERDSGGGFGPTVQLEDGALITAYSYRDALGRTHLEAVRWRLD